MNKSGLKSRGRRRVGRMDHGPLKIILVGWARHNAYGRTDNIIGLNMFANPLVPELFLYLLSNRCPILGDARHKWVNSSCDQIILRKFVAYNCWCHQKSDFKAKLDKIRFPLRLRPIHRWGRLYSAPPTPSCT